jgi:hypothetical protein
MNKYVCNRRDICHNDKCNFYLGIYPKNIGIAIRACGEICYCDVALIQARIPYKLIPKRGNKCQIS